MNASLEQASEVLLWIPYSGRGLLQNEVAPCLSLCPFLPSLPLSFHELKQHEVLISSKEVAGTTLLYFPAFKTEPKLTPSLYTSLGLEYSILAIESRLKRCW